MFERSQLRAVVVLVLCFGGVAPGLRADAPFVRGDVNQNGEHDISDQIGLLGYLFLGGGVPSCLDATDANDDGGVDLADVIFSLSYLFLGGEVFPAPFPDCGADPTPDQLACAEFASPHCEVSLEFVAVRALSRHYVLVSFGREVGEEALDADLYEIRRRDNGLELAVHEVIPDLLDETSVILVTDPQERVEFELAQGAGGNGPIVFQGSDNAEPRVVTAISLGSTETEGTVLLTFSEAIEEGATDTRFYKISDPDLEVRSVEFSTVGQPATTIELTTDVQRNLLYTVKVTNVKGRAGDFLVDPTRNLVSFWGIPPVDTVPPRLTSAVPSSNTEVVLSFSEPLWPGGDDPRNYVISCFDPFTQTACPDLAITNAEMAMLGTQVVLTTLPQGPAFEYTVTILNRCDSPPERDNCVQDLQENPIDPAANTALFLGLDRGQPFLSSAISLGPDPLAPNDQALVVLRFSEPVLDGAENTAFYSIDDPDLDILAAALSLDGLTVTLTTEAQQNRPYTVRVTNVRSRAGGFFIDPERSSADFVGIPPVDTVKPTVSSAASTGDTGVLVSFSEPLLPGADDPLNFSISCQTLGGDPCGALTVTSAELTAFNTQVLLTTSPQTAFVEYTVTVADRCAISQDNCVQDLQENPIDPAANSASFFFDGTPAFSDEAPRVVGAISTGNNTVVVQFSRPMSDSVLDPTRYFIVQENLNPEVGALIVVSRCIGGANDGDICSDAAGCPGGVCEGPRFIGLGRLAVELKTLSQNEVTYAITAIDVTDVAGRPIQQPIVTPGGLVVDPRTASFPGSPPSGATFVDTDGDGLTDNVEQRGWLVTIELTNGTIVEREVTSDPFDRDTDGDLLDDLTELSLGTDPRARDTDSDTLDDEYEFNVIFSDHNDQDTDDDGISDALEVQFFRTNALVDDSDGDGFTDDQELFELNRDPRIADLPEPDIDVSQIVLRIDERFTYTDDEGETQTVDSSSTSTFERSSGTSLSRSSEKMSSGGFSIGITGGVDGSGVDGGDFPKWGGWTILGSVEGHAEFSSTFQVSSESVQESVQTFERSVNKGFELTQSRSVTREVVGASIEAFVNLDNRTGVAFALEGLEVTISAPDPRDRRSLLPVATLLPNSTLVTGEPATYHLGAFEAARGPILFGTQQAFPNLVESLMRDPSGLVLQIANYDLVDEFDRNFAFTSQMARDRTVGVVIDSGDGTVERFFVAAAPVEDDNGDIVGGFGNFPGFGPRPSISLGYVFEDVLLLERSTVTVPPVWTGLPAVDSRAPDAIRVGLNGVSESIAAGDDLQLIPAGIDGLPDDAVVISAGEDGILQTIDAGDDTLGVTSGFSTSASCGAGTTISIKAGPNGVAETRRGENTDDLQNETFGTTGLASNADVVLPGNNGFVDTAAVGDDVYVGPGVPCDDAADCPGGACDGQEILYRLEDRERGELGRFWTVLVEDDTQLGADFDEIVLRPGQIVTLGFVQDRDRDGLIARQEFFFGSSDLRQDTDGDQLDDFAEVKAGWEIQVAGSPIRRVFPDPRLPDSDFDGLSDYEEQDVRRVQCECVDDTDSTLRSGPCTPRIDSACEGGPDDGNPCASDADCGGGVSCEVQRACPDDESCLNVTDKDQAGGALIACSAEVGFQRTDPRSSDTDSDLVSDAGEVLGFLTGGAIIDPRDVILASADRTADTEACPGDVCTGGGINEGERCRVNRDCGPAKECVGGGIGIEGNDCVSDIDCTGDPSNPGLCEVVRECDSNGSRCLTSADCGGGVCEEVGRQNVVCEHPSNGTEGACDDVQVVEVGETGLDPNTVVVAPGHDGVLHSTTLADAGFAQDLWVVAGDLDAGSTASGDDEQVAAVGIALPSDTFLGRVIIRPGFDGVIESSPGGDDVLALGQRLQTANPLEPDSDGDLLSDGFEQTIGADPRNPADGQAPTDADRDGLLDSVEESTGWLVSVNGNPATRVFSNPRVADTDLDGLPDLAERQLGLDPTSSDTDGDGLSDFDEISDDQFTELGRFNDLFPGFMLDGTTSEMLGTDPHLCDTDGDKLPDGFEVLTGWTVRVITARGVQASQVFPDPLLPDTDFDGLSDAGEYLHSGTTTLPTDPTNPDTDEDGRFDGTECAALTPATTPCAVPTASFANCTTNPLADDLRVTVSYATIVLTQGPQDGPNDRIDLSWSLRVQRAGESFPGGFDLSTTEGTCVGDYNEDCDECLAKEGSDMPLFNAGVDSRTTFTVSRGQGFLVHGEVNESDGCPGRTCQGGDDDGSDCTDNDDCAGATCDVDINFQCHLTFFRPFTYDMLQPGFSAEVITLTDATGEAECRFDVVFEVLVE